jgi:amidohydrolase
MWNESQDAEIIRSLTDWRRTFHQYPELSNEEERTGQRIAEYLRNMGIDVQTFSAHHGVCGIIEGVYPGPTIALRADMDALSITEDNDIPYKSERPGIMHACGHDGHMAILLGVADRLARLRHEFAGTVKLLFQPAEEAAPTGGASFFIQEGVLDDVEAIFGLHLWPDLPSGQIGFRPGPFMGASDRFCIKVLGKGAHASQPHKGIDAITMAAEIIQGVQNITSRQIDPMEVATLSIGTIQGGERYNVIAREVLLEGTIRTLSDTVRGDIPEMIKKLAQGIALTRSGSFEFDYRRGYPILSNWVEPTNILREAAIEVLDRSCVHANYSPTLAGEDFSNYLKKLPGCFFFLGCADEGRPQYSLHNSRFDFDERILLTGVKVMCQVVSKACSFYRTKGQEKKVIKTLD